MWRQAAAPNAAVCGGEKTVTKEEAKRLLQEKAGLSQATIVYLDSYRYGDELIVKLAQAMG